MIRRRMPTATLLATALVFASGIACAQSVGSGTAKSVTDESTRKAAEEARIARREAAQARRAAAEAATTARSGAVTGEGEAAARYHAYIADQASRRAQDDASAAVRAANRSGAARSAAFGGTAQHTDVILDARAAQHQAHAAGDSAQQASMQAALAAQAARDAIAAPPPPPPRQPPVDVRPSEPLVTITSSAPDSIVGEYRIDFAALDRDGNGWLSRGEAASNATLAAEFDAVDNNRNGRLDRGELKGWMR